MTTNRIARYEHLWKPDSAPSGQVPNGFAIVSLGHLDPAQRAAVAAQQALYQWAYDRARADADERFIHDWVI